MDDVREGHEKSGEEASGEEVETCPVHGVKMRLGRVPIQYGLPISEDEDHETSKLFPFANENVNWGCCIGSETSTEVKYCPGCRSEKKKWLKERWGRKKAKK